MTDGVSAVAVGGKCTASVTVKLPQPLKTWLRQRARSKRRRLSEWCRMLFEDAYDRMEARKD